MALISKTQKQVTTKHFKTLITFFSVKILTVFKIKKEFHEIIFCSVVIFFAIQNNILFPLKNITQKRIFILYIYKVKHVIIYIFLLKIARCQYFEI